MGQPRLPPIGRMHTRSCSRWGGLLFSGFCFVLFFGNGSDAADNNNNQLCAPHQIFQAGSGRCMDCQQCEVGEQFLVRECTPDQDALCANCSVCDDSEYTQQECNATHDTICRPCLAACTLGATFQPPGACGPEKSSSEPLCHNCTQCASMAAELRACNLTHDTQCRTDDAEAFFSTVVVSLTLASEVPPSAFTVSMLQSLSDALALALGLSSSQCEVLLPLVEVRFPPGAATRRQQAPPSSYYLLQVEFRLSFLRATNAGDKTNHTQEEDQIQSLNLDALATRSGLPIQILAIRRSSSTTATRNVPPPPHTTPTLAPTTHTSSNSSSSIILNNNNNTITKSLSSKSNNGILLSLVVPLLILTCVCSMRVCKGVVRFLWRQRCVCLPIFGQCRRRRRRKTSFTSFTAIV